jgi:hypothetical protein
MQLGETAQASRVKLELEERFRAMQLRGEDARLHGREFALYALWIENNPAKALAIAQSSLAIQKEPLDWWVYASSARALGDPAETERAQQLFRASGLVDHRVSQQFVSQQLTRSSKGARL